MPSIGGAIGAIGGAVNDLFQSKATAASLRLKAQGNRVEAENYDLAGELSKQNLEFTKQSTAIKQVMTDRQIYQGVGTTQADVGGAGFAASGSALDIMRSGQAQGALTHQVVGQQGLITEAGYDEQTKSYANLAKYARYAAEVQDDMAGEAEKAGRWSSIIKFASANWA